MKTSTTPEVHYGCVAVRTPAKDQIGTRRASLSPSAYWSIPNDPKGREMVHALQDAITVSQPGGPGTFTAPNWDASSQVKVRDALLETRIRTVPDTKKACSVRKGTSTLCDT